MFKKSKTIIDAIILFFTKEVPRLLSVLEEFNERNKTSIYKSLDEQNLEVVIHMNQGEIDPETGLLYPVVFRGFLFTTNDNVVTLNMSHRLRFDNDAGKNYWIASGDGDFLTVFPWSAVARMETHNVTEEEYEEYVQKYGELSKFEYLGAEEQRGQ